MAEEITNRRSTLRLDNDEDEVIDLRTVASDNSKDNFDLLLIGKLVSDRPFNVEAFRRTMMNVWSPEHGLVIRVLGPYLFGFQFFHWRDKEKVFHGRPWCWDNKLILMKEVEENEQPDQIVLSTSPFWVHVKNLPFSRRSDSDVAATVAGVGEVMEIESDVLGLERFRRVRIMVDITKPLRRLKRLIDKGGREVKVEFAYERLPFICFACGILGHSERDCSRVSEEEKRKELGWGLFLRASPCKGRGKYVKEMEAITSGREVLFVTKEKNEKGRCGVGARRELFVDGKQTGRPLLGVEEGKVGKKLVEGEKRVEQQVEEVIRCVVQGHESEGKEVTELPVMSNEVEKVGSEVAGKDHVAAPVILFSMGAGGEKSHGGGKSWKRFNRQKSAVKRSEKEELVGAEKGQEGVLSVGEKRDRHGDSGMVDVESSGKIVTVSNSITGLRMAVAVDGQSRPAQ
ncbi:uncharacterized protein [Spinacia oleracea]|uniref:CCHC-type domain-containing protein n=1 Tax=Spinacia oleracea TaxID=3562 RepID=A0A9R0IEY0_SPIOL|nr:uncharacterized protein LOC110787152 [Spinacia oleracea]